MAVTILGISAYYHDSAACVVSDGDIVAAAQEERFTRKRHDERFPSLAIRYCLNRAALATDDLSAVVFYDKPLVKFERLLETYLSYAPRGFRSFVAAMPIWLKEKLYLKSLLKRELAAVLDCGKSTLPPLLFAEHHQSHAASAFFPSPFEEAAVLCMDGVGEWATTSAWQGEGSQLSPLWQINFPHSLGLLYSAFTYHAGFRVNSGEYKLMGLAPYGEPRFDKLIRENLIDIKDDGSFQLNMEYFDFCTGLTMTNRRFDKLFSSAPRQPEEPLTQHHMDMARSIQSVTEDVVLRLARTLRRQTGKRNLCMAGGVALNCVANGRLLREKVFDEVWVQPAAGDAGGAVGAALSAWHGYFSAPRTTNGYDKMKGSLIGPEYADSEVESQLAAHAAVYRRLPLTELIATTAEALAAGKIVGWFQGRMEFGPRALGNRSIIGDPRDPNMQSTMNLKIKFRESFRPFAPSVLASSAGEYFEMDRPSPYMLIVAPVAAKHRLPEQDDGRRFGLEKLKVLRSDIPAVTHVDYSARIQTVQRDVNERFHDLIEAFGRLTGCPMLINTSFNVRGEPIVCTPDDAYRCFMRTNIDALVIGNHILFKHDQPEWSENADWRKEIALD